MDSPTLFTIGHSNRDIDEFVELLAESGITAVADVRSQPYSRHVVQFNREQLHAKLKEHGIAYVFIGKELGARRSESCCYVDGQARYDLIQETAAFRSGLDRIRRGALEHCIALMCAEKDPVTCHRSILISKALRNEFSIRHILGKNDVEPNEETERRLLKRWRLSGRDLFDSSEQLLEYAYARQAKEIAFVDQSQVEQEADKE